MLRTGLLAMLWVLLSFTDCQTADVARKERAVMESYGVQGEWTVAEVRIHAGQGMRLPH